MPIVRRQNPNSRRSLSIRGKKKRRTVRPPQPPRELPEPSFMMPPEPGPCGRPDCKFDDFCTDHCRVAKDGVHVLDRKRMGWAKARTDNQFDVACALCGEVGTVWLDPATLDIDWGGGLTKPKVV